MEADDQGSRLAELAAKNAELAAKNTELAAKNAELAAKNAELEAKLGQNSRNSHLPPSSDGPGAGKKNERKPKSNKGKRKRGGQKGHRGAHRRLLPPERVGEIIDVSPRSASAAPRRFPSSSTRTLVAINTSTSTTAARTSPRLADMKSGAPVATEHACPSATRRSRPRPSARACERDGPARALGRRLLEYTSLVFEYWHRHVDGKLCRARAPHDAGEAAIRGYARTRGRDRTCC